MLIKPPFAFLRLLSLLAVALVCCGHSAWAKEVPLWEGVVKTPAMIDADKKLVEAVRQQTNGDLTLGAKRGVQLGWQALGKGDADLAVRRFNQAWLLDPDNGTIYWGLAVAVHARGDDLGIVDRWFAEAERRLPGVVPLMSDRGRVLQERGENQKAIPFFQKALAIDPKYIEAHVGMVRAATAVGDVATAARHSKALDSLKAGPR